MHIRDVLQDVLLLAISQVRAILAAWVQFTHIPLPPRVDGLLHINTAKPNQAIRYLPLVNGGVGLIAGLVFWICNTATGSSSVAVIAAITTMLALTGAFRERGAGHFFDTFSRSAVNNKARAIGATGTIALCMIMLAKWQLLAALPPAYVALALAAAGSFSTFATMAFLYTHKPLLPHMHGRYTDFSHVRMSNKDFMIMALFGMAPVALMGHPAYLVLLPLLWIIRALLGAYLTRRPERYTSDALAATQQCAELGFYLGVLIIIRILAIL